MINKKVKENSSFLERISTGATRWIGSTNSLVAHTLFFIGIFALYYFGVDTDEILLILTTIVSLEAIYLAIFIQMTVNRQAESLAEVEEDLEDIEEDIEDISQDIDEIQQDEAEQEISDLNTTVSLRQIQDTLTTLARQIEIIEKNKK